MERTASPRKIYSVRVEDIPDHERLIFKLIFSVSHKTRGRSHAYVLHDGAATPDVVLGGSAEGLAAAHSPVPRALIVDRGEVPGLTCIQRPLIATRVLGTLDRLVADAQRPENDAPQVTAAAGVAETGNDYCADGPVDIAEASAPLLRLAAPGAVDSSFDGPARGAPGETGSTDEPRQAPSVDTAPAQGAPAEEAFSITEDEASELAIVHDDTLANPANRVETPAAVEATPPAVEPANVPRPKTRRLDLPRALVVDDSPAVRKQLELELHFFATEVDYAGTGAEAARLLEEHYYDVAFLDVMLPDTDGFRICKRIKALSKSTNVLMLTGKATQADRVKGALAGCDDYLVKPVGRTTFQDAVKRYLEPVPSPQAMGA